MRRKGYDMIGDLEYAIVKAFNVEIEAGRLWGSAKLANAMIALKEGNIDLCGDYLGEYEEGVSEFLPPQKAGAKPGASEAPKN